MLDRLKNMMRRRKLATGLPTDRAGRGRRLLARLAIGFAVALVLFTVVGFFVVPPVAKHYAVKILSKQLGRQVSIQEISVNPFAMTAVVRGFAVKERDSAETFVAFEELFVNLQAESIWRRAPVLNEIRLTRPFVHLVRLPDGQTYNFSDLAEKFAAGPKPQKEPAQPARFSLNNIQLLEGRIQFHDRPRQATHDITDITIAIPFVSNLPYLAKEYVQPAFAANVNGTPFALKGQTKPFEDSRETTLNVDIDRLPIPRYIEYVPAKLNFRIPVGLLSSKLLVSFVRYDSKAPVLRVTGDVTLNQFELTEPDGSPLLNLPGLAVPLTELDVFGRKLALGEVALRAPEVFVRRDRDGSLNWMKVVPEPAPMAADASPPAEKPAQAMQVTVTEVRISDGQVHFLDQVPAREFRTDLTAIQASLKQFSMPQQGPATLDLTLDTSLKESVTLNTSLGLTPLAAEGRVAFKGVRPGNYAAYFREQVLIDVDDGQLALSTGYRLEKPDEGEPQVVVTGLDATLNALRVRQRDAKDAFLRIGSVSLKGLDADLAQRNVQVATLQTRDAKLTARRGKDGAIDLTQLVRPPAAGAGPGAPGPAAASTGDTQAARPWSFLVRHLGVERSGFTFDDQAPAEAVTHVVEPINLKVENLSNRKDSKAKVALDLAVNKSGSLRANGEAGMNPVAGRIDLVAQGIAIVPLQPYFQDRVNLVISSGDVGAKGAVQFALPPEGKPRFAFAGDVAVANFASVDKLNSEDFLKWKSLFVGGIDTVNEPFSLDIREVSLSDFYSRIVIFPSGRLNLQDIMATAGAAPPAPQPEDGPAEGAAGKPAEPMAPALADAGRKAEPAPAPKPAEASTAVPQRITIGKVTLQGGDVNFTDLFIKPYYSANLSEIGGAVTGLSSQLDTTADIDLQGRFAKTAPIEIKGKFNPLVKNLFLDIKAGVRDIELGPFTPYSGRYVGYAIEKGKMTFNVEYKVENRKLAASNQIVLNQLTFGDKIESPQATKLPVLLAVALLRDRNGVIDVNLPISGSLDDPKFSVGGIIIQIIFNLIEKAVTAPFALIGGLVGGGGEELAFVEFEPGRAQLTHEGQEKLAKLRQALVDRPGLKLDILPRVDSVADREGLRRYRFEQQVKAQKVKETVKKGTPVSSVDEVKIEPEEYSQYLKRAYKEAKFPKPRNALGFAKDLPAEEMEKLMLTNIQVTDDDLMQLANARAQAAKDFITKGEQVALERVFLLSPKSGAAGGDDKHKTSRVDFSLK